MNQFWCAFGAVVRIGNRFKTCARFAVVLLCLATTACHKPRVVNVCFYYWKTVYQANPTEQQYLDSLHSQKLYVRMMDVDQVDETPVPVSPISFQAPVPAHLTVVPVVFIVNRVLKHQSHKQLDDLARKMVYYVTGKMKQSGHPAFTELQIDCDWTRTTRSNYFYLLKRIKADTRLTGKQLSVTLRLHQLKNQQTSGVPPANRVMLMCYNMGNLRQYGEQNSILNQHELKKYAGDNLAAYAMPVDIGLPLFSWAVVFRQKQYAGISKKLSLLALNQSRLFKKAGVHLYRAQTHLPAYGIQQGDEVRWENIPAQQLYESAQYLQKHITADSVNVIYFHLDQNTIEKYTHDTLEKTAALFR
jgi:hypothetical protein